jgi:DnaJ family protein A protein 2
MFFNGFPGGFASEAEESPAPTEVDNKEFYEILELPQDALPEDIKKSYRKKVIKLHPDKGGDPEDFKKLQAAYEILSNPEKREVYDKYGLEGLQNEGGSGNLFDLLRGMHGGHGGGRNEKVQRKLKPTVVELNVTLEDLYLGKMKSVSYDRQRNCETCDGKGGQDAKKCKTCKGSGVLEKIVQLAPGFITSARVHCPNCDGEGTTYEKDNKCKTCDGKKIKRETKTLDVPVEQGAPNESHITFSGEGNEIPDIMAGDLIVTFNTDPHESFERKGADLYYKKTISLYEALTGTAFYIEHLDGKKILVATASGEVITPGSVKQLNNKGMPFYKDTMNYGNLYIIFDVEFPKQNQIKNVKGLEEILPVPKDLIKNEEKTKCELLEDFDSDGVNSHAEGGRKRSNDEDEDDDNQHGRGVQCAQQ